MSVRVVARIRPLLNAELEKDIIVKSVGSLVKIPNPKNAGEEYSFQFNNVYGSESTQQDLFDGEIAPTVKHLFNGYDVTLFAYGVTGTGKTHTMRGGKLLADRGVIPRLLSGIYRRSRKVEKESQGETQVEVVMSYYEIYNDKVFDLFEHPDKRTASGLSLRDNGGKTVVVGLTERPCESLKDFEKLYDQANVNRSTSATKLNAHSSRSHAILCVKIITTKGDTVKTSTASAIDLAGSEDNRRTDNNKERLVESSAINKSLFVLAQCVEAISKKQSRIPYRESKMTRILSLGQNNGLTIMILNLAPVRGYHSDTLTSLNFANRTKKIEIREAENEPMVKGPPRSTIAIGGSAMQRQALRPLTTTTHNINVRAAVDPAGPEKFQKPAKAFSVFADKPKPVVARAPMVKRSPLKRNSDHFAAGPRSIKRPTPGISQSVTEDMVEKKVTEMLAARALDQPLEPTKDISEDVRKRLEYLEQKIEGQEDDRAEGLSFLLMAKQHQARGEDSSALKMYELAREHFPNNHKLEAKIDRLKSRIQEKRDSQIATQTKVTTAPVHRTLTTSRPVKWLSSIEAEQDDYQPSGDEQNSDSDASHRATKPRKQRRLHSKQVYYDGDDLVNQTPRTKHLLSIINSRDIGQIRLLKGVGSKKAEAIIEALCGVDEEAIDHSTSAIQSLAQLGHLRGIGGKTVENWRLGLSSGVELV